MKKAIVTGATGFIGKWLTRELVSQGIEVYALVRKNSNNLKNISDLPVRLVECDIHELRQLPSKIKDRNIDVVFHIAWQGVAGKNAGNQSIQMENLQGTLDLIDAMKEMNIKTFVGAGSLHEAESIIEMSEDKVVSNLGYMYKATKMAAHWMGTAKAGAYGIRFFWPLINTYGEEENSPRLINTMIRKIFKGETPELSAGEQYYDFVHVCDVAKALCFIAEKGVDGTNYVIGSGNAKPLKDYLTIVGQIANNMRNDAKEIPLKFGAITSNVVKLPKDTFDVEKIKRDTGFCPSISFEDGIVRTAKWIKREMTDITIN